MENNESKARLVGYARVSTADQDLQLQLDALKTSGCDYICQDKASGALTAREGLDEALAALLPGDTLVVWKLDRLGRSVKHLVDTVLELQERGVGFRSITEGLDTTTNGGKLVFHIFAAIAEFERGLIQERTRAGLAVAHARGHASGRKPRLSREQVTEVRRMHAEGKSVAAIARLFDVSRPIVYRALEKAS
jgi:DNA invertase Pin-like site-specific DNA recombinase